MRILLNLIKKYQSIRRISEPVACYYPQCKIKIIHRAHISKGSIALGIFNQVDFNNVLKDFISDMAYYI